VRQIRRVLFDEDGACCVLAWDGGQLAGRLSTRSCGGQGLSQSLYLKELYIGAAHRRKGVGKLLMDGLARDRGKGKNAASWSWTTDDTNLGASGFMPGLACRCELRSCF